MEAETTETTNDSPAVETTGECNGSGASGDGGTVSGDNDFVTSLSFCGKCKENLRTKHPKLLPCLHTFCFPCISTLEHVDGGLIKCSTCGQQSQTADIIDNMFVPTALKPSSADATPVDDEVRICTGCEENMSATFFCVECVEWLCDQCTQAHKRVKVTKDHTIEAKENVSGHGDGKKDNNKSQVLFCPCHPQEQLKLYCNTCGKLTCRDCQLVEHKDHKYQFLQEAALSYKDFLQSLLVKIKEKQTYIDNAKSLIDKRNKEIIQKEQNVINEVKIFAMSLITEINLKCRQLVGDLQSICTAKKRQLQQKESEIKLLSENLEHSLQFAEHLLRLGDETGLLYSRRTLAGQLRTILQTRCEVPNPYHVVDLRFTSNSAIGPVISKLGYIIVDGITFNRRPSQVPGPGGTVPQGVAGVSSSSPSGGYISPMAQLPVGSVTPQPVATQVMSAEQKQALLTSMRKSYERSREERRLQQHQIMQRQQMQQQHGSHGAVYMGQSRTDSVTGYSTQRLSHLPNQSANISSTIVSGQQLKMASASGTFYPSSISLQNGGYTTSLSPPGYSTHGGGQISLAQLQEDRMRRQSAHHSSNSSMRPIVIEPTAYEPPSPLPSYTGSNSSSFLNSLQDAVGSSNSNSRVRSLNDRSVCDLSLPNFDLTSGSGMVKKEMKPLDFLDMTSNSASGSRTPTPLIESTTLESSTNLTSSMLTGQDLFMNGSTTSSAAGASTAEWTDIGRNTPVLSEPAAVSDPTSIPELCLDDGLNLLTNEESSSPSPLLPETENDMIHVRSSGDPSDDYCAVCNNGGELLCCDGCPKVFHMSCHVSQLSNAPSGKWFCGLCTPDDSLRLETPDLRTSSKSLLGKRHQPTGLTVKEQKVCERLLLELFCEDSSMPFHEPVAKSVPNYYKIITSPMDLGTIRNKLSRNNFNRYQTVEEFLADVRLVFFNCAAFNQSDTEVGRAGQFLQQYFESRATELLPYLDLQSIPASLGDSSADSKHSKLKRRKTNSGRSSTGKKSSISSGDGDESLDGGIGDDSSSSAKGGKDVTNNEPEAS